MTDDGILYVAGESGLVGSQITKVALEKGYRVYGTMCNANDESKRSHLMVLPDAEKRLTLFSADAPLEGADAVDMREHVYKGRDFVVNALKGDMCE